MDSGEMVTLQFESQRNRCTLLVEKSSSNWQEFELDQYGILVRRRK
jgi:hypothetical protein